MVPLKLRFLQLLFLQLLFLLTFTGVANSAIVKMEINGAIGPAVADYVVRGIEAGQNSSLILLNIDTPGGLLKSTRQITKAILNSVVPVVVYVSPRGARAASAGTFLVYASTIAAMAPGTHLGAATPVDVSGNMDGDEENEGAMNKKVMHDSEAYIRTLAEMRKRNEDFAVKAVVMAETLTAKQALKEGVINIIANDEQELLSHLDGMEIMQGKQNIKLITAGKKIVTLKHDWRMRFLLVITDPTIAYLLLLLGIYGIFFELINPGFVVPGVIGAIAILVGLYALQLLPINYAGLSLIIFGLLFIIAESFAPSFGILGIGGTAAFVVGSIFLLDTHNESYQIARSAICGMAVANVILFVTLFGMAWRARNKPKKHGMQLLIGARGRSLSAISPHGQAIIHGEIWSVQSILPIGVDKEVKVVAVEGLQLEVIAVDLDD